MRRSLLTITVAFAIMMALGSLNSSAASAGDARSLWEVSCMIRKDKFDYVLPGAMRRNGIDMWIVLDRGRGTEPMSGDFGSDTVNGQGIYIFFDPGEGRIERMQLGADTDMAEDCGAYDEFGEVGQLETIVDKRDPKKIALNFLAIPNATEGLHLADGISHTDYKFLENELGAKYASRFVSAQHLIADFHGERVAGEIIEFSKIGDITRKAIERALSNEVITPGKTSLNDVVMWLEERREEMGLQRGWYPSITISYPNGQSIGNSHHVIQRGDVFRIDWGIGRNNFSTDIKRFAYVLKEGETEAPPGVLMAFDEAKKVGEIIRKNVRSGRTGREQLDDLKQIIRDAGYVYTEVEYASDVSGIEVNVGMHAAGNIGHDVAAGLFEIFPERTKYVVRPNSIISLEYRIFFPAAEWNGAKIPVHVEENALITERGIEWLYPPQHHVLVIR
jgi:Xaa-Pro aminopeptidase